jgi:hypothetical protein
VIGAGFHDVGINVDQGAAYVFGNPTTPETMRVEIDVKPGDDSNRIRPSSNQVIPVAVLTTPNFDATTLDPSTVCFGADPPPGGTTSYNQPPGVDADCNEAHRTGHLEDVDGDGDLDMVLHFETRQTGIDPGDTEARLTGRTTDGTPFEGSDFIRTDPNPDHLSGQSSGGSGGLDGAGTQPFAGKAVRDDNRSSSLPLTGLGTLLLVTIAAVSFGLKKRSSR